MIQKYRALHRELNMMFEVKSLVFTLNLATIASKNDLVPSRTCSFDDIILMQSTGLLDKNGDDIFEGDVVSFSIDNGWDYVVSKNGLIIYSDGCYQILENGIKYRINQCLEEDIEVIGNMYELERVEK